ncbi:MAG: ATP-dependent RNA helicase dbp4 [Sarcosagium campestre]|nr:MAG: ATP-dependent RNA helicase dbp4 [Sarcosagium campestre]
MAPSRTPGHSAPKSRREAKNLKRKRGDEAYTALETAVAEFNPKEADIKTFSQLPLSKPTSSGLQSSHFTTLTDIQARAIPLALKGADCLGAAKTGSGKTLAFLVPVLEKLYRQRWTELDGLGALIISPTRELAIQIFDVLRKIGRYHSFSAGLVIGGKSLQEERERLSRMNILVCTPGRMLQHMDQTAAFEVDNLQILVLDEADRILDMGFQSTVDAIVEHLPTERQTLLFSATQTRKVSDLARLSLSDPEYISVHEAATSATPSTLQQHYVVTPLPEKLNTLYSFLRSNVKAKILVFLSSGKQVRFVYESFRHLQPGLPLLHLHGRQKQTARLDITTRFSAAKHSCLFATDVVARGLDFPAVDWVIQLDCPEDADTYIHRVGRTARYEHAGRAVLFLDPSEEEGMLKRLEHRKVPIEQIKIRQKKQQSIQSQLQNMCFKDPELKYLGQKAFISYAKSIHLQKDKEIFKLAELPLEEFSTSLGLPGAPRIKFLRGDNAKSIKNAPRQLPSDDDDDDGDDEEARGSDEGQVVATNGKKEKKKTDAVRTRYDRMFERTNQDILTDHYAKLVQDDDGNDSPKKGDVPADQEDFLTVKRRLSMDEGDGAEAEFSADGGSVTTKKIPVKGKEDLVIDSKRREKLLQSKKKLLKLKGKGSKLVFDEDGNSHEVYELEDEDAFQQRGAPESQRANFVEEERVRVQAADRADKELAREKRKIKKEKQKARQLATDAAEEDDGDEDVRVELAPYDEPLPDAISEPEPEPGSEPESIEAEAQPVVKRAKKWFEDDSGSEAGRGKGKGKGKKGRKGAAYETEEPETLENLEEMALGLLG